MTVRTATLDDGCTRCGVPLVTDKAWRRLSVEERAGRRPHSAHGMCRLCYNQRRYSRRTACKETGCPKPWYSRGWCGQHYQRWRRYGHPTEGGFGPENTAAPLPPADIAYLRRLVGVAS